MLSYLENPITQFSKKKFNHSHSAFSWFGRSFSQTVSEIRWYLFYFNGCSLDFVTFQIDQNNYLEFCCKLSKIRQCLSKYINSTLWCAWFFIMFVYLPCVWWCLIGLLITAENQQSAAIHRTWGFSVSMKSL